MIRTQEHLLFEYLVLNLASKHFYTPWNFLGDSSVYCADMTLGGLLHSFQMGVDHHKDQAMIRILELPGSSPHPLGRVEGLEIELMINHAYTMKPL